MTFALPRIALLLGAFSASGPVLAQEIGRLFTTPTERAALDRWRDGGPPPPFHTAPVRELPVPREPAPASTVERSVPVPAQVIVVNGVVTRSGSGRSTTWVNSLPYHGSGRLQGNIALLHGPASSAVTVTLGSGKTVLVKPGQSVDPATGRVREAYQRERAEQR